MCDNWRKPYVRLGHRRLDRGHCGRRLKADLKQGEGRDTSAPKRAPEQRLPPACRPNARTAAASHQCAPFEALVFRPRPRLMQTACPASLPG